MSCDDYETSYRGYQPDLVKKYMKIYREVVNLGNVDRRVIANNNSPDRIIALIEKANNIPKEIRDEVLSRCITSLEGALPLSIEMRGRKSNYESTERNSTPEVSRKLVWYQPVHN